MASAQGYSVKFEGLVSLGEVELYLFHSTPSGRSRGQLLFLGGSNFDLRIKRVFRSSMLLEQFEFVTYEPRGLSRSSLPAGVWSMSDYARDAKRVLDYLGWERPLVLGESFGGMTALNLAHEYPERLSALMITSATAGGEGGRSVDLLPLLELELTAFSQQMLLQQDSRNAVLLSESPADFAERLARRVEEDKQFLQTSGTSGGYKRLLEARRTHDVCGHLTDIRTPTLVMAGAFDLQAPVDAQRALAQRLPQGEFILQQGGHGFLFASDAPQQQLLDWIEALQFADQ